MKKISYITLHYISNYGSVLQTYATQCFFESLGYNAECVNYIRNNCSNVFIRAKSNLNEVRPNVSLPYRALFYCYYCLSDIRRQRVFNAFIKKKVHLSQRYNNLLELKTNPPVADVYCTGSDQTWNSEYNGGVLPEYYLDYAPNGAKCISYAASFGMEQIPENEADIIRELLKKYSYISVREQSAVRIVNSLKLSNPEIVLDPTLTITADAWRKLETGYKKKNYILMFSLYRNRRLEKVASKLQTIYGLPVVKVSFSIKDILKKDIEYLPKVGKLLSMIDNATVVVTDSFHGTAFSLNFNKDFFVVYPEKYSTRIQSILNIVGCESRIVDENIDFKSIKNIDYVNVNRILTHERERSKEFIENACG